MSTTHPERWFSYGNNGFSMVSHHVCVCLPPSTPQRSRCWMAWGWYVAGEHVTAGRNTKNKGIRWLLIWISSLFIPFPCFFIQQNKYTYMCNYCTNGYEINCACCITFASSHVLVMCIGVAFFNSSTSKHRRLKHPTSLNYIYLDSIGPSL